MKPKTEKTKIGLPIAVTMLALIAILIYLLFVTTDELVKTRKQLISATDDIDKILCRPRPIASNVNTFNYTCNGDVSTWVQLPLERSIANQPEQKKVYRIGENA
jgi:hypothetical protein